VAYYYHYTSRQSAQDIACGGQLKPGRSGSVYLTPQVYASGIDAADYLAIMGKPVEIGVEVDIQGLGSPSPAHQLRDASGAITRRGGGLEIKVSSTLPISNPAKWMSLIEP
jgi:hypothetical protein